ncbi:MULTISPECIES: CgeB family protein [Paenibacillus]|uniref:CgeB family protein n=1 Tax=Paenibacillus TaxID=44249 RepID=UPI002FDFD66A
MNNVMDERSGDEYRAGYTEGYRFGGCKAVLARIPYSPILKRNLRVLYVQQGFDAIDGGVAEALRTITEECIVASPDTMLQAAASHRPDLVLVMNALHVFPENHADQIVQIRQMGIRTAVWFVDDPYFTEDTVRLSQYYDAVFTHELECVPLYRKAGCGHVHYLPLAADPALFRPLQVSREHQYDICFIGNAFWNRVELFDQLAPYLQGKRVLIAGGHWDRLPNYEPLSPFIRNGWIPVEETVSFYNGAKIVINMHRPTDAGHDNRNSHNVPGSSINPRTYEISGCGTLQITDIRQDLTTYYRPGYDIETFQDADELRNKIEYYLTHEHERLQIAWRSLWTTRRYHTFTDRLHRLLGAVLA